MIKLIDENFNPADYEKEDIYSVKILSLLKAYGTGYSFVRFYAQYSEYGEITAIISYLDSDAVLSFSDDKSDKQELADFFGVIGFSSLLCDNSFELGRCFTSGVVMRSGRKAEIECSYTEINEYPYLLDLFNFVDYGEVDFESWYVDISHRIRHFCAKAATLNADGEIISSAIFSSIYNDSAVLTAVRTMPEHRGRGYASYLVSAMCNDVRGTVYLMRESNKNEAFYNKLFFENIGIWRIYK